MYLYSMNFLQVFPDFSIKVMVFLLKAWYGLLTYVVSLADFFKVLIEIVCDFSNQGISYSYSNIIDPSYILNTASRQ